MENVKRNFLSEIGKTITPKRFRAGLREYLAKAGIYQVPYELFGILFIVIFILTFGIYFGAGIYSLIGAQTVILSGIFAFVFWAVASLVFAAVFMAGTYFYFNMKIYNRTKLIEDNLPDFLVLVSTNLKGGLSFEKSLWGSIKPEFGILAEEMSMVSKRVMTGNDLTESLMTFAIKYDSPTLRRTINIIIGEVESGGQVAHVLDQIIENLRKTRMLKDEMAANTLMFTIFIGAIVIVISPLLFALAFNLVSILVSVSAQVAPSLEGGSSGIPFTISEIAIDVVEFKVFSFLALSVISVFSSMILSIIQKGEIRGGIKYIPFFVASSVTLYFVFLTILSGLFKIF